MIVINKKPISRSRYIKGAGLLNKIIDKLPFEAHIPGYKFCGPGTKLAERLARGDQPINLLDSACKDHDISYSKTSDISQRHIADSILQQKALERINSKDSTFGERVSSRLVNFMMGTKRKMGAGMKKKKKMSKKKNTIVSSIKKIRAEIRKRKPKSEQHAIQIALKAAHRNIPNFSPARIIPIPKTGGVIPLLIPIIAALSGLAGVAGGVSNVVKTIKEIKNGKRQLDESERHNRKMESIALTTSGKGLYLRPYKTGYGITLNKTSCSKNY